MKMKSTSFFIYLIVSLFLISMSSEMTVNLQYGENSMYNEIEHTSDTNLDIEETKIKIKVCEKPTIFDLALQDFTSKFKFETENLYKYLFWISDPTPPPEFVG